MKPQTEVSIGTVIVVGTIVAIFASGCGKQSGIMSPSGASPSAASAAATASTLPPATGLRFDAFLDDNMPQRAAIALRPAADGVQVQAYNLGANGYAEPVASIQLVVRYDESQVNYLGPMGHAGWYVEDRSRPGEIFVIYRSNSGDVTGDADIGRLRFTVAEGAQANGDSILEILRLWKDDGSIARAANGNYSQVSDFGGGIFYLTGDFY